MHFIHEAHAWQTKLPIQCAVLPPIKILKCVRNMELMNLTIIIIL